MLRRKQKEEGRSTGPKGDYRVTYNESANRTSQGNGIALATGSGPIVSQSPANVFESGNAGGRRRGPAESRGLLLAAEYRDSRGRTQRKRSPYISGAFENGGNYEVKKYLIAIREYTQTEPEIVKCTYSRVKWAILF